jgi:hypothetical protein
MWGEKVINRNVVKYGDKNQLIFDNGMVSIEADRMAVGLLLAFYLRFVKKIL